jgi:hypothetical protein
MSKITDIANTGITTGGLVQPTTTAPEPVVEKKTSAKAEIEALELESKKLELEAKKLEILEKQANLQDLQERLAERELKRETKRQRSLTNGQTLKQLASNDLAAQKRCNHRKGGNGAHGVVGGMGDDSQYAVLKHTFCNGDMWVRCLRCGKTWKPPIREHFDSEADYLKESVAYETAINFQTRNVPSGSVTFRFSDNGKYYREVTANSTLR